MNDKIKTLIESFEDKTEGGAVLTDTDVETLVSMVTDKQTLTEGLTTIGEKAKDFKNCIDQCDKDLKEAQEKKKNWDGRMKQFTKVMGCILGRLGLTSVKSPDGTKIASSTRTVLEVDEEWLVSQYENLAEMLRKQLPEYVKVSLSVDKNKLSAYLKGDNTLLLNNPDKIHTKSSTSFTIKWADERALP